jgi:hypothetical protein
MSEQEQIERHPDYLPTYRRWLSVCLAAGRDRKTAEERARGYAFTFVSRQLRSREYLRKHIGPNVQRELPLEAT